MAKNQNSTICKLNRHDFPDDFLFGAASSAYQIEGGYDKGRKTMSMWDTFSLLRPGKISDGSNGCIANDHYGKYKEDVALMKKMGLDTYRFSISWSRILPCGKLSGGINREGVKFYNDLIDLLLAAGITPFVTIFHFDLPKCLQDEYGGFLHRNIVHDFAEYANVCFFEFGDRVKHWITINESWTYTHNGYITAAFPPGHGSPSEQPTGNGVGDGVIRYRSAPVVDNTHISGKAATEPYKVAHHLILAHARAVDIYRRKYQVFQGGIIGVTNMTTWFDPYSDKPEDVKAAKRAVDFMWGWFVEPIVTGDYPKVMRDRVKERLPVFTPEEEKMVKGSYDFIGMNYYTSNWCAYKPKEIGTPTTYYTDQEVEFYTKRHGIPIGRQAGSDWLFVVPVGIYQLLVYTKEKYNDPIIYITENGVDEKNHKHLPVIAALEDDDRIEFHEQHLAYMKKAMDEHQVNVKGYMIWALFDTYEWPEGYTVRFGLYYIDYNNNLDRYPKNSAIWYMNFLNKNRLPGPKRLVEEIKEDNTVKKREIIKRVLDVMVKSRSMILFSFCRVNFMF
ncbi:hypothetical protein DH2020_018364 [Rehmannia glutinosa]|uniref:Beta-glucosidase n=1 Tax=Rehmannia glutinosa TaxID=99300 RepID=A0ABR0WIT9_REHGL